MSAHDPAMAIGFIIEHSQMSSLPLIYNHTELMKREYIKTLKHRIYSDNSGKGKAIQNMVITPHSIRPRHHRHAAAIHRERCPQLHSHLHGRTAHDPPSEFC